METLTISMSGESLPLTDDPVARAQAGDREAFAELYHENSGRVYALCLRMVRDATLAEDLTQEAFVRAWQKLKSFRGESAFSTWLHRLTVNVVLSNARKKSRRDAREFATENIQDFERSAPEARAGQGADLEAAIAALPEGARRVFVLHDVEGYRHTEIAEMLGVATGTTKAQLHRARKLLREKLK